MPMNEDTRAPRTMLWADGMSAQQARKALFGDDKFSQTNAYGGKKAVSKWMKLANPGMFH